MDLRYIVTSNNKARREVSVNVFGILDYERNLDRKAKCIYKTGGKKKRRSYSVVNKSEKCLQSRQNYDATSAVAR